LVVADAQQVQYLVIQSAVLRSETLPVACPGAFAGCSRPLAGGSVAAGRAGQRVAAPQAAGGGPGPATRSM